MGGTRPDLLDEFDARLTDIKRLFAEAAERASGESLILDAPSGGLTRLELARMILWARGMLEAEFGAELFANPALNILIALYISRSEGQTVSTSQACNASGVPTTTALRWINALARRSMVLRRSAPADKRYTFLELSDDCAEALDRFLQRILNRLPQAQAG